MTWFLATNAIFLCKICVLCTDFALKTRFFTNPILWLNGDFDKSAIALHWKFPPNKLIEYATSAKCFIDSIYIYVLILYNRHYYSLELCIIMILCIIPDCITCVMVSFSAIFRIQPIHIICDEVDVYWIGLSCCVCVGIYYIVSIDIKRLAGCIV